jgi:glycosyltransferase involved in cell wall biosynthesis
MIRTGTRALDVPMVTSPHIHIINPMTDIGGSELHAIDMYRLLTRFARATIWTESKPAPKLLEMAPIRRIRLSTLSFPRGGVLLFVGAYFGVGHWLRFARPQRMVMLYNIVNRPILEKRLASLELLGKRQVELVYASENLKVDAGRPGLVEDSPIDLDAFSPAGRTDAADPTQAPFVVGRASRDDPEKFAESDPTLFSRLAACGYRIRVAGGTCLRAQVPEHPLIEIGGMLPPHVLPRFLQGLDCFLYRTSSVWQEAYGRVVAEAMACGLPVIVSRNAGIAQYIDHGLNGFLADTDDEVIDVLERLRADVQLRQRTGKAARRTMEQRYSEEHLRGIASFYLSGAPELT